MSENKKLTPKQERFVEEYLLVNSCERASRESGLKMKNVSIKKYYVYFLVDPRTSVIFYVGKGTGDRKSRHVKNVKNGHFDNSAKCDRISEILRAGEQVQELVFAETVSEEKAYSIERELIESFANSGLTNMVHGVVTKNESFLRSIQLSHARMMPKEKWLSTLSEEKKNSFQRSLKMTASEVWDFLDKAWSDLERACAI